MLFRSGLTLTGTVTTSGYLTLGGTLDLSSPPSIGNTTRNSGAFTTLSSTGNTSFSGANVSISIQPTGTGVVYVNPATTGAIDNMTVGATTPSTGKFTTLTLNTALGISYGGTGATTQQGAINALAGAVTSGYYLRGNGTNVLMSAIQATDVPTLNQNTTGSAGSVVNSLSAGSGLSGSSFNGSAAVSWTLATAYGDTINPYASKTANYILAAPNGVAGVPVFRAIVAADIPTLNQNTTGSSGSCTGNSATATSLAGGAASRSEEHTSELQSH